MEIDTEQTQEARNATVFDRQTWIVNKQERILDNDSDTKAKPSKRVPMFGEDNHQQDENGQH